MLLMLTVFAVGCSNNKDDSRLAERSEVEAKAQIKAEEDRTAAIVADLKQQSMFYEALYGEFEGTLIVSGQHFKLRANFVPQIPIYISDERTLTVSEAEDYLINQSFNIHLTSWDPSNALSASGCQVEGVKPDLLKGEIYVSSESCSNLFLMAINDETLNSIVNLRERFSAALDGVSEDLAAQILSGDDYIVEEIVGEMRPTTNAAIHPFRLVRVR
tara:strand:+ start:30738 stop:31385 length:648 start_codon:yes stop_codon:yes gene_type:complete